MRATRTDRRDFIVDTARIAGVAWLALQMPWLAGCAPDAAPFAGFTTAERKTMRAFATRILPSSRGAAGADEADAAAFIERALTTPFFAGDTALIRAGLAQLDARARRTLLDGGAGFADLPEAAQVTLLREIEKEGFFLAARKLVLIGTFADPSYGGNRGMAGWTMIGIDHRPAYAAPYGYYDAQAAGVPTTVAA